MKRVWFTTGLAFLLGHAMNVPLLAQAEVGAGELVGVKTKQGVWLLAQVERLVKSNRAASKLTVMWAEQQSSHSHASMVVQEETFPIAAVRKAKAPAVSLWTYPLAALHLKNAAQNISCEDFAVIEQKAGKPPKRRNSALTKILQAPRPSRLPVLIERYQSLAIEIHKLRDASLKKRWLEYTTKMLKLLVSERDRCLHPAFVLEAGDRQPAKTLGNREILRQLKEAEDSLAMVTEEHARNKQAYRNALCQWSCSGTSEQGEGLSGVHAHFDASLQRTAEQMKHRYNAMHAHLLKAQAAEMLFKPAAMRGCYPHFVHFNADVNVKDQGVEEFF